MKRKQTSIVCPIFKEKEWAIEQLTRDLNSAKDPRDKVERAEALKAQVSSLLECHKKEGDRADCKVCELLAQTRTEMANLIIRVHKLKGG